MKTNIHWNDCCWSWSSNTLTTWCKELTHWIRPWCWERLRAEREGDDRGRDGWIASLTQWTWVWARSKRQWRTGKPRVLQSMGSQRAGHNLTTEQQQQLSTCTLIVSIFHINGTTTRETETRTGNQWCSGSFQALEFCRGLWFPSHSPCLLPGRGMDYHSLWNQVSKAFQIHSSEVVN